jgi:hypothetical protein
MKLSSRMSLRWTSMAVVVVLIGVTALAAWRWGSLRRLPDVPDPFDLADNVIDSPEEENAYTFYRRASEAFTGKELGLTTIFTDESVISDADRRSLEANREALAIWLEGTKRVRAVCFQPRDANYNTLLVVDQRLASFAQLAHLQAYLARTRGDHADAWNWIRASLRASRHLGTHGFLMERLLGIGYFEWASKQASIWADDPDVNTALLRKALDDVIEIDALTPRDSGIVRYEFFAIMNTLDDAEGRKAIRRGPGPIAAQSVGSKIKDDLDSASAFLAHEPEISRRLARYVLTNWLATAELTRAEREKRLMTIGPYRLFLSPASSSAEISIASLEKWINSSYYVKESLKHWSGWNAQLGRDEVNRANLIVHLATVLYRRERGRPPETPEALVGPYLKALPEAYSLPDPSNSPGTK